MLIYKHRTFDCIIICRAGGFDSSAGALLVAGEGMSKALDLEGICDFRYCDFGGALLIRASGPSIHDAGTDLLIHLSAKYFPATKERLERLRLLGSICVPRF